MSYQIELQDKSTVEKDLTISIERAAFNGKFEQRLSRLASQAHLKGFRPGKAPKDMVKKTYGPKIYDDVLNDFVNEALRDTLTKNKMPVIDTAISNFSNGESETDPVKVNLTLSLFPEPKVENYQGLTVEYKVKKFDAAAVEDRLNRLREMFGEVKDAEGRTDVKAGDIITMTYVAMHDGVEDKNLSANDQMIELGKSQLPEEIEKEIIGAKLNESREVKYTFPETASEELKNKEYVLNITVTKLQEKVLPEVNDEFAKKSGLGETVEDVKTYLEKQVKRGLESSNNESRDTGLLDAIIKENDFELPQVLVDREIRNILAEMRLLNPKDKNFETAPVEQYRHILTERASERVKRYIIIDKLLELEKIDATDTDVEKFLDEIAEKEGRSRTEIDSEFGYPKRMDSIKRMSSVSTLFERLSASSKLVETEDKTELNN